MKVINLFGGPGSGKSTSRAGLFYLMKTANMKVEEAPEWIKQKVYPFTDQLYVFAKQARILKQLKGKVDYAVTDSPLLLSYIFAQERNEAFDKVIIDTFNGFDNINIFLKRVKPYQQFGRYRGEEAAREKDREIKQLLQNLKVPFITLEADSGIAEKLFNIVKEELQHIADNHGYSVRSEERLDTLSDKFLNQVTKYGKMYCPCQNVRNESTVCPCRYMRDCGFCKCGLFMKKEVTNGNQKENL